MIEPEFDRNGYPTESTLERIKKWDFEDWSGLIDFITSTWHWPDYAIMGRKYLELHTGGWSGNEDVICALQDNLMIWGLYWHSSERGGHYKFLMKRGAK